MPLPERLGIVKAEDLDVGGPEAGSFDCSEALRERWHVAAREDVLDQPRRCGAWRGHPPDRVEQADAFVGHELAHLSKELVIVPLANVLKHAHGNDAIVSTALLAIVEELERYLVGKPRSPRPILRHVPLLLGQSEADDLDIPLLGEVQSQSSKT